MAAISEASSTKMTDVHGRVRYAAMASMIRFPLAWHHGWRRQSIHPKPAPLTLTRVPAARMASVCPVVDDGARGDASIHDTAGTKPGREARLPAGQDSRFGATAQ